MRIFLAIALTLCSLATAQAQNAVHRLTADPRAAQMAAVVHRYAQKGEFSGAVLVAQRGRIIYAGGAGMANSERNVPNTPDTAYPICSITKQMTAVLVLQQAAAGGLSLGGSYLALPAQFSSIRQKCDTGAVAYAYVRPAQHR